MKTIKQPETAELFANNIKVERNLDDNNLDVSCLHSDMDEFVGFAVDPHRARQLYNAIGEVMGFDKPAKTRSAPKGKQEYKGNGKHKWELVSADPKGAGHTYRLRVPGGWLYRTVSTYPGEGFGPGDGDPISVAQSFVPVPDVVGYAV
jgi:hypothetical protein